MKKILILTTLILSSCGENNRTIPRIPLTNKIDKEIEAPKIKEVKKKTSLELLSVEGSGKNSHLFHRASLTRVLNSHLNNEFEKTQSFLEDLSKGFDLGRLDSKTLKFKFNKDLLKKNSSSLIGINSNGEKKILSYEEDFISLGEGEYKVDLSEYHGENLSLRLLTSEASDRANVFISTPESDYSFLLPKGESFLSWLKKNQRNHPTSMNIILNKKRYFESTSKKYSELQWVSNVENMNQKVEEGRKYWFFIAKNSLFLKLTRKNEFNSHSSIKGVLCQGDRLKLNLYGEEEVSQFSESHRDRRTDQCRQNDMQCTDDKYTEYKRSYLGPKRIPLNDNSLKNYVTITVGNKSFPYKKEYLYSEKSECEEFEVKIKRYKSPAKKVVGTYRIYCVLKPCYKKKDWLSSDYSYFNEDLRIDGDVEIIPSM